jgi:hypothetical protein
LFLCCHQLIIFCFCFDFWENPAISVWFFNKLNKKSFVRHTIYWFWLFFIPVSGIGPDLSLSQIDKISNHRQPVKQNGTETSEFPEKNLKLYSSEYPPIFDFLIQSESSSSSCPFSFRFVLNSILISKNRKYRNGAITYLELRRVQNRYV